MYLFMVYFLTKWIDDEDDDAEICILLNNILSSWIDDEDDDDEDRVFLNNMQST